VTRYTFLVQVLPDGISTLENLSTHERSQIVDFAAIGPQIEAWLATLAVPVSDAPDPAPGPPH
jgi:hypothetical protein